MNPNQTSQLLCSFTDVNKYKKCIQDICDTYEIVFGKIFTLNNVNNQDDIFLTYNVVNENKEYIKLLSRTISLHRVKQYNVLYTLDGLNRIVKEENNGVQDVNYKIDWSRYKNSLISTNGELLNIIPTKLNKIWNV